MPPEDEFGNPLPNPQVQKETALVKKIEELQDLYSKMANSVPNNSIGQLAGFGNQLSNIYQQNQYVGNQLAAQQATAQQQAITQYTNILWDEAAKVKPEENSIDPSDVDSMTDEEIETYQGLLNIVQYGRNNSIPQARMVGILEHAIKLIREEKL